MAILVAEGSNVAQLQSYPSPIDYYAEGQRGQVILTGPGLSLIGDLAGAEQIWAQYFTPAGAQVIDVHGEGSINPFSNSQAVIDFVIPGSAGQSQCGCAGAGAYMGLGPVLVLAIIGAIGLALLALGWAINNIRLTAEAAGPVASAFGSAAIFAAIAVLGLVAYNAIGPKRKT